MAGIASPARDIPTPNGRDSFAAVAARSVPLTKTHPLPTPPNSISPSLRPHGLRAYGTRAAVAAAPADSNLEIDSDLDLQAGSGHDSSGEAEHDIGSPGSESAGAITTALLAKHHLPEILLAHGPLAIRHITGYLTTSVPGFSGIAPAKARRLVVGALEGRGVGDEEGMYGEVKFEKVGWGRWTAKVDGQAARVRMAHSPPLSGPSSYAFGLPISRTPDWTFDRTRLNAPGSSWAGNSTTFSHDDMDVNMLENEADKMSMDGDRSCSSSEAPADDEIMGDDPEDMTDDEDWAAVGAAALREAFKPSSSTSHNPATTRVYTGGSHSGGGPSLLAKTPFQHNTLQQTQLNNFDFASNPQEREAVEALLRLGSV